MLKPVLSACAMAAASDVDSQGEEDGLEVGDDWGSCTIDIARVHRISVDKRRWFPEAQEHDGRTFITLSKSDAALCLLVTGKGMNRHSKREAHDLNVVWWSDTRQKSNSVPNTLRTCWVVKDIRVPHVVFFWLAIFCRYASERACTLKEMKRAPRGCASTCLLR